MYPLHALDRHAEGLLGIELAELVNRRGPADQALDQNLRDLAGDVAPFRMRRAQLDDHVVADPDRRLGRDEDLLAWLEPRGHRIADDLDRIGLVVAGEARRPRQII